MVSVLSKQTFRPDYTQVLAAASNQQPARTPLYDHGFDPKTMEALLGQEFWQMMWEGDQTDRVEAYRRFAAFGIQQGYDVIPVEFGATWLVQGGLALCGRMPALFTNLEQLEAYPWDELVPRYIEKFEPHFRALAAALPPGMKAIGGVGNGIFETAQDFVPLLELPFLKADDPPAFERLWQRVGDLFDQLWRWFLANHADSFAVCRMGDDLGFKSATLLNPADVKLHILPQYKRIVDQVHARGKKFLLHSCGKIFDVMEEIITGVGIDAKHSNEDTIAPFSEWLERYGSRIGIFGGIDMDLLCRGTVDEVRTRTREIYALARQHRGVAIGCGNSIANYVPIENFVAMTETVRELRGE